MVRAGCGRVPGSICVTDVSASYADGDLRVVWVSVRACVERWGVAVSSHVSMFRVVAAWELRVVSIDTCGISD